VNAPVNPEEIPHTASSEPEIGHESCAQWIGELEERVAQLELASVERHLQVLELAERVAERLQDRVRKRTVKREENGGDDLDRRMALTRRAYVHEG
jgi:hypothetical protein